MLGEETIKVPGIITYVDDELNLGRIKANAPKLFTSDNPAEDLPWIYPRAQGHTNQFRSPKIGDMVWITHPSSSYSEYWYEPFPELDNNTREIMLDYTNAEVLLARTTASGNVASIYVTDDAGLNFTGDGSKINLTSEGEIILNSSQNKELLIESDTVKVGETGVTYQQAVLGEELKTLLSNLSENLSTVATATEGSPYTKHLAEPIKNVVTTLNTDIAKILSSNVKLN